MAGCRFEHELPGGPWQYSCHPALIGEAWYDDYVRSLLDGPCKDGCSRIKASPLGCLTAVFAQDLLLRAYHSPRA